MSPPQLLPAGFTNRGYWLSSFEEPGKVVDLPIPQAGPGSAVVQVVATLILPYVAKVHRGEIPQLNLALPLVPNANCVGRVLDVGPDAARIRPGDWVWVDGTVHARDDALVKIVQGHHGGEGPRGRVLMQGEWRDGSMQKVMKAPLESCHLINKEYLFGQEGHAPEELTPIILYNIAGGAIFETAKVQVGETVVIGPATGSFGGAAVELALLSGAKVIMLGRSEGTLRTMKERLGNPEKLQYIAMSGDEDKDTEAIKRLAPGGVDVFNDWTPGWFEKPLYLPAALKTLNPWARIVLSGAPYGKLELPYKTALHLNWQILARWANTRDTLVRIVKLINDGVLKIGKSGGSEFKTFDTIEDVEGAKEHAADGGRFKSYTVLKPNGDVKPALK